MTCFSQHPLNPSVHSTNKCDLIERVLDADSNEPSLASIRKWELSQMMNTGRHMLHITWQLMMWVLLSSPVSSCQCFGCWVCCWHFLFLYFPKKYLFGVFLVRMTALCAIRTTGELTALKLVFIALPLNGSCKMHGSQENATSNFRIIFTPSRLPYIFPVTIPEDPTSLYYSRCFSMSVLNILMSPVAAVLRCAKLWMDLFWGKDLVLWWMREMAH